MINSTSIEIKTDVLITLIEIGFVVAVTILALISFILNQCRKYLQK